jgi:hypothetical protein
MVSNTYGTFNPAGIEPYPIETSLAQAAATSPAEAQLMLNSYTAQRQATAGQYADELDQQHAQAKAQIAAQMYDAQLRAFNETVKTPGALAIARTSPALSGILGGADPDAVQQAITGQTNLQNADIFSKGATGVASLTTAGMQPTSGQAGQVTGLQGLQVGDPTAIQAAKIAAAARIAAASISANNTPGVGYTQQLPLSATGGVPTTANISGKLGWAAGQRRLQQEGLLQPDLTVPPPPGAGGAGGGGAGGGGGATTPAPTRATNLPPAKTEGAGGTGPGVVAPNTAKGAPDLQKAARTYVEGPLRTASTEAYNDVMAGAAMNGGNIALQTKPDGSILGIKGKSGRVY